ncbi:very short patch repair endonuclease [Enterococcus larvae]|uniref:very short patch repair endonuclease n=1 Tax=Enterococcus larvae TaxID=2794352 RepID=UPI003F303DCA
MKHQKLKTTAAISKRMSNVKLKEGKAEILLAKALWHQNIRYRKNYKKLPGSPDIAITKYKLAIFVDGEFWHGYDWENKKRNLKNNKKYWTEKIEENIARDKRNDLELVKINWKPIHFWEQEVLKNLDNCLKKVLSTIDIEIAEQSYH